MICFRETFPPGYNGFLSLDDDGMPLVAKHWEQKFNNMVNRYNEIIREQMPNITSHVCHHIIVAKHCSLFAVLLLLTEGKDA